MTTKFTILNKEEVTPILDWIDNRFVTDVAKSLGCSKRSLHRHLSFDPIADGWKFPTERLEKLKQLMK